MNLNSTGKKKVFYGGLGIGLETNDLGPRRKFIYSQWGMSKNMGFTTNILERKNPAKIWELWE